MGQSTRIGTGQITVTSAGTLIVPSNQDRVDLRVSKLGAENVFLGCNSGVTTSSGFLFAGTCGAWQRLTTTGAVWGITVGASVVVTFAEVTQ